MIPNNTHSWFRIPFIIILFLILSMKSYTQDAEWHQTANLYVKTYDDVTLSQHDAKRIKDHVYIVNKSKSQRVPHNQILFSSPVFYTTDSTKGFAIDNKIILYNVYNLRLLIRDYISFDNIAAIDSIDGEPIIYILTVQNHSYSQIYQLCKSLCYSSYCDIAEPNYVVFAAHEDVIPIDPTTNPKWTNQWGLYNNLFPNYDIDVQEAWNYSTGEGVKVAVIDCGFELNHPDLVDNIYSSYDCTDGADGAVNGQYGISLDSHGTQCAGVIAATNNNIGIIGVAPNSKLILIRHAYNTIESGDTIYHWESQWSVFALRAAYMLGADVISCSWSFPIYPNNTLLFDLVLHEATAFGRNGKGSIVVFSTGNQYNDSINFPSDSPYTIAVGALNRTGLRATFSNYGTGLDVVAPGQNIYTTQIIPYGSYCYSSGTSFACPMVAGVAALILSIRPDLTSEEVYTIIRESAYKLPYYFSDGNSWNSEVGYGLVNAYAAISAAKNMYIQNTTYVSGTSVVEHYPEIFAGYSVTDTIPYGNVLIKAGSNITYEANFAIHLLPGFSVEQGGTFRAYIEPVAPFSAAPSIIRMDEDVNLETDIKEVEENITGIFTLKPNPAIEHITISSTEPIESVKIYNLNGQMVLRTQETEIDVSSLPAGLYVVHAQTADGQYHQAKFIHL